MHVQPNQRRPSSSTWRDAFTPWKFFVCLLAIGLWAGLFQLLGFVIPGDTTHATSRQVNGGVEFTIKNFKYAWWEMYGFLSFFVVPALVFWWFWPKLSEEFYRVRGISSTDAKGTRAGNIFGYCIVGFLVSVVSLMLFLIIGLQPLNRVHRITVRGDDVRLESLYRSWNVSRRDIQQVDVSREFDKGRGGPHFDYLITVRFRNGEVFRSPHDLRARPPDGEEDQRYGAFFAQLRAQLTKKP
jgi:hypothetical protein